MQHDLEFSAEEFALLSREEKITRCTQLAERAQAMGRNAPPEHRRYYLEIAKQWLMLAEAIRAIASVSDPDKTRH